MNIRLQRKLARKRRAAPHTIRLHTTIPHKPAFRMSLDGLALALLLSLALGGVLFIAIWSILE